MAMNDDSLISQRRNTQKRRQERRSSLPRSFASLGGMVRTDLMDGSSSSSSYSQSVKSFGEIISKAMPGFRSRHGDSVSEPFTISTSDASASLMPEVRRSVSFNIDESSDEDDAVLNTDEQAAEEEKQLETTRTTENESQEKEGLFGFVPMNGLMSGISSPESDERERSASPARRTQSSVETRSVLRDANGEIIDLNQFYDDSDDDSTCDTDDLASTRSMDRNSKQPTTKSDEGRRGSLQRAKSATSLYGHHRKTNVTASPPTCDRITRPSLNRIPQRRRGSIGRHDNITRLLPTVGLGETAALVGRGVKKTKTACSDLVALQLAVGRCAAKTTVRGVAGGGAAIMGGLRATQSVCADLADVPIALVVGKKAEVPEPQPDPLFVEMVQWNPLDADDRAKYDDEVVYKLIRKNPDAMKAKYEVLKRGRGRSNACRSALSTIVALGASLETVRAAIKCNPNALRTNQEVRSTPLHTACSFNSDMMVVRYIYHKYPAAISATTKHVFLPLHNACQRNSPSLDMIQFLVEAYPEGLTEINKLGDTPLRTAERNTTSSPEVLAYLKEETDRIFGQSAQSEIKRREVQARQMWGSVSQHTDDTHRTNQSLETDTSEDSTSAEFSDEFAMNPRPSLVTDIPS